MGDIPYKQYVAKKMTEAFRQGYKAGKESTYKVRRDETLMKLKATLLSTIEEVTHYGKVDDANGKDQFAKALNELASHNRYMGFRDGISYHDAHTNPKKRRFYY